MTMKSLRFIYQIYLSVPSFFEVLVDELCSPPQPQARILIAITEGIKKQKEKYLIDAGINS